MRTRLALTAAVIVFAATLGVVPRGVPATEAAGPGTWSPAASLTASRQYHTASLLPNGKVLVTGGQTTGGATIASAELYAPASDSWSDAGSMTAERRFHTATLLKDGRILVVGGTDGAAAPMALVDIYSPATNSWSAAAPMAHARSGHGATLLLDGRVLVAGGDNLGSTSSAELYNPASNSWTPAMDTPYTSSRPAFTLPDGRVYHGFYIYSPMTNTWTTAMANGTFNATSPTLVQLGDGRLMSYGGNALIAPPSPYTNRTYILDITTDTWNEVAGSAYERAQSRGMLLGNGKVLFTGGIMKIGGTPTTVSVSEMYDPATNSWTGADNMTTALVYHTMTQLSDGRVLTSGGSVSSVVQLYDPTAWVPVASPPVSNSLYSPGMLWGGNALFFDENAPQQYDPVADAWAPAANGFVPSSSTVGGVVLNTGNALSIDGTNTQVYNRVSGTWSDGPDLLGPDAAHIFVRLNDGRVLITSPDGTSELYNPTTNTIVPAGTFSIDNFTALVTLVDGRVLAPGGLIGGLDSNDQALLFDPGTGLWSTTDEMATARTGAAAVRLADGRVLVSGGDSWHLSGPPLVAQTVADAEIYSPISNTWTTVPSMLHARINHSLTLLPDGRVLATGGCQQEPPPSLICTPVTEAEAFNPSTNTWSSAGQMHASRVNAGTVRLTSGDVLVAGGGNASAERYDLGIHTDTDGDGYNDGLELALSQHPWSTCKTMRADVSGDGLVNVADLGKVAAQSGKRPPPSRIDQNGDKIINVADLGLTASQSGKSVLSCA